MMAFAQALAALGVDVVTFNFLYTEQKREAAGSRAGARGLLSRRHRAPFASSLDSARRALFIGGKSMGGRIATQVAAADPGLPIARTRAARLSAAPAGPARPLRDAHLPAVGRPMLFVQGSRDAFGTPDELAPILGRVSPAPALHEVVGGDHSFKLGGRDAAARQAAVYDGRSARDRRLDRARRLERVRGDQEAPPPRVRRPDAPG